MARVRFLAAFDYKPTRAVTIAYKAGHEVTVKRACSDQAIAAGKAVSLDDVPRRPPSSGAPE